MRPRAGRRRRPGHARRRGSRAARSAPSSPAAGSPRTTSGRGRRGSCCASRSPPASRTRRAPGAVRRGLTPPRHPPRGSLVPRSAVRAAFVHAAGRATLRDPAERGGPRCLRRPRAAPTPGGIGPPDPRGMAPARTSTRWASSAPCSPWSSSSSPAWLFAAERTCGCTQPPDLVVINLDSEAGHRHVATAGRPRDDRCSAGPRARGSRRARTSDAILPAGRVRVVIWSSTATGEFDARCPADLRGRPIGWFAVRDGGAVDRIGVSLPDGEGPQETCGS